MVVCNKASVDVKDFLKLFDFVFPFFFSADPSFLDMASSATVCVCVYIRKTAFTFQIGSKTPFLF